MSIKLFQKRLKIDSAINRSYVPQIAFIKRLGNFFQVLDAVLSKDLLEYLLFCFEDLLFCFH